MSRTVLLVGGPRGGETMVVESTLPELRVATHARISMVLGPDTEAQRTSFEEHLYRPDPMRSPPRDMFPGIEPWYWDDPTPGLRTKLAAHKREAEGLHAQLTSREEEIADLLELNDDLARQADENKRASAALHADLVVQSRYVNTLQERIRAQMRELEAAAQAKDKLREWLDE